MGGGEVVAGGTFSLFKKEKEKSWCVLIIRELRTSTCTILLC
jgi:hypothetical protein